MTVTREQLRRAGYDFLWQELTDDERNARRFARRRSWTTSAYSGRLIERNWAGIDYLEFLNTKTGEIVQSKNRLQAIWRLRLRAFVSAFGGKGADKFQIVDVMRQFGIDDKTAENLLRRVNEQFGRQTAQIDQSGDGRLYGNARYTLHLAFAPSDEAFVGDVDGPAKPFDREAAKARRAERDAGQGGVAE